MLEVKSLSTGYVNTPVLSEVSLAAKPGEVTVLVGPNGAGKTTLLKTMAGAMRCWQGEILLDGQRVDTWSARKRLSSGIALVPEGRRIVAGLTVKDNLRMGGYILKDRSDFHRETDRVLELFPRLRDRFSQDATTMSGGEQQMLAIARALISRPRFLLLDEPSTGLAPILVTRVEELIADLARQGIAVVLVEQNAAMALRLADWAGVLEHGRIVASGEPSQVLSGQVIKNAYLGVAEG